MERARRDAANPLRVIQEAARFQQSQRRRAERGEDPAPAAPRRATARSLVVERSDAEPVVESVAAMPSAMTAEPDVVLMPPASAQAMQVPQIVPPPDPTPTATSALLPQAAERDRGAETTVASTPLPPPRLMSMVEPAIPQQLRDRLRNLREVFVDLSLRADGSVAAVVIEPGAPPQLRRYVEPALEQWQYAPIGSERMHRVVLVFNTGS
jgi:hypothetical protein